MIKKRTKKYQGPKYVSTNPAATFLGGMTGQHADQLNVIRIGSHMAMADMTIGKGSRESWDRLVGAINMANVMVEMGIGNEFKGQTIAARDALCECGKRAVRTGRFIFKGSEISALNEALDCHDAQITNVRAVDIDRAANEVIRRIRHGLNTTNVKAEIEKGKENAIK